MPIIFKYNPDVNAFIFPWQYSQGSLSKPREVRKVQVSMH